VTLVIASVLFAFGAVELRMLRTDFNLQFAADRLAADIRSVQQRAVGEQTADYYIDFYTHIDTYRVKKWDTPFSRVITEVRLPQGVDLYSTNFPDNHMGINAEGLPLPHGGTITLRNRVTGKLKYVIVASITGRVRVSDHPPESWEES
jgi:Tfp pilus assembly protein FimT